MRLLQLLKPILALAFLLGLAAMGYFTRQHWLPLLQQHKAAEPIEAGETVIPAGKVIVNEQAQQNLGLVAKPAVAQSFWKTIQVPGMVVDRPGYSDRNVVTPVTGIVTKVLHVPGDTIPPGEVLFTLKLLSETLHLTQTELFKNTQDIKLAEIQRKRLADAGGAISESRIIEVDSQLSRLRVAAKAYRQELLNRGFGLDIIEGIAEGKFINEVSIVAPPKGADANLPNGKATPIVPTPLMYEVQELKVELGQQVQAGQTLCLLASHQLLAIEGRAFRDETTLLERSVKERWPVEVDFREDVTTGWPPLDQTFRIGHMANTIDPVNRTFAFLVPLVNQSRVVEDENRIQTLWRFRPGQKVRILVRVEKLDNVMVLPADAVAHDGPEAYVFSQNVNTFERKPVRIVYQERQAVVIANEGAFVAGTYLVQSGAAQLNRMIKAGGTGVPKGYHIHADGSLHKNEDEGK
ncbi:MAG TPA: hypothetical protein PLX97_11060 [Gemmatales bacterium]|nr:hypothetical protein [Gemmatales bacterium]